MKKVLLGILAVIGALAILATFAFVGVTLISILSRPTVPGKVVLELDFESGLIETIPDDPVARLMLDGLLELRDVVEALERGADDRRVAGVVARIGGSGVPLAQIQEIRDAVFRFRDSGKPAIAFSETFGEFSAGNGGYYLATAFDKIYMQPSGDVGLTGLMYETMFLKGGFEKLGVTPRIDQRYEYKNAANSYLETGFTEAHRESLQRVMDSRFGQIVAGISEARGLSRDEVRQLIDRGPFLGDEALENGLVDGLAYRDEVYAMVREEAGERSKLLFVEPYLDRAGRPHSRGTTVALIHGFGGVIRGEGGYSPLDGSIFMGSDAVTRAFRAAIDDRRVKAILFRVDSPGGSYVASDTIWREVARAREEGKPVIVSMGNLAGSGGYFVALEADKIVAQPGTITASIGVYGGKMLTNEMWSKLGIVHDDVHSSANATHWSTHHDYEGASFDRWQAGLDRIYEDFTSKVAEGRKLQPEKVDELARGRIWTGEDALELGLVDALGGYDVALDLVREAIDLDPDAPLRLKRFPARRSTWDLFLGRGRDNSERAALRAVAGLLEAVQPQVRTLRRMGLLEQPSGLVMPEASALGQ